MITLEIQRHIIANIRLSNGFMGVDVNVEICGSTIFLRARDCQTEVKTMTAKQNAQFISNAIAVLDGSIYDYELENATRLIMELI
ncbi:hypothetical protein FDI95_gp072 [Citrobacter phage CF1 ERZ-2017]|uniref:Uncharacterized protein n=1 Tax=Citrobacter phage CF1 ERZ-2017 TaxID=2267236 RepID=A0A2H4YG32_9CAUD|nr:hypothetical protein FDI95_gp072 [Citrobacter phage CF1 ERZ-2017]AUE22945.1 hypothetical protein Cf1_00072 [Citrobacter phage CF1 ERZ-2017]